jgi:hypothetical protein
MRPVDTDPALPEVERMLIKTAAAQIDGAAAPAHEVSGKRRRGWRGRLGAPRVAALGFVFVLGGGTALAATGVWDPPIGALTGVPAPRTSESRVPLRITDVLGILRREQTPKDRSPEVEATLARAFFANGIRPSSVRFLAPSEAAGEATVLFSAERSPSGPYDPPEKVCFYRPAFATQTRELPFCTDLREVLSGQAFANLGNYLPVPRKELEAHPEAVIECIAPRPHAFCPQRKSIAAGLVPDGVAMVTLRFSGAPARTIPVHHNYFEAVLRGAEITHLPGGVRYVIMRDAEGNAIQPDH